MAVVQLNDDSSNDDYTYETSTTVKKKKNSDVGDENTDVEIESMRFKNRRRFAYMAMYSILIVTSLLLFYIPIEKIKALETIITWFYMTMGSIVGFYMGAATWAQITGGKR